MATSLSMGDNLNVVFLEGLKQVAFMLIQDMISSKVSISYPFTHIFATEEIGSGSRIRTCDAVSSSRLSVECLKPLDYPRIKFFGGHAGTRTLSSALQVQRFPIKLTAHKNGGYGRIRTYVLLSPVLQTGAIVLSATYPLFGRDAIIIQHNNTSSNTF